ncbi:AraC family transcriptional regulator ligand-binding domain-containing protein [Thalassotalea fonticola]|uniref:AraC family transcriptional regulator ligand-binding domain-containing protein n=1 Tax=Thalassotalea fonticola TaxID=3065649 RepID=A0ABZ0GRV3_9GAMM|nr:AraC family transcriptional regulator ligand-binding domain-containing protein [Colwelliaceae bacterium S1-1]
MANISPTSFYGNAATISQALNASDVDTNILLLQAGINIKEYKHGINRVPYDLMGKFIELGISATDPSLSLKSCEFLSPASYHALGVGLLYSDNLRSFCQRYQRYFALISTLLTVEYHESGGKAWLSSNELDNGSQVVKNFDSDCFAAITVKFIRMIRGPEYTPKKISLIWTPSDDIIQRYHDYFRCEIEFSAKQTAVCLEVSELDKELPASNRELARESDKTVTEFLEKTAKVDLKSRVMAKLIEFLPSGNCSRERVAMSLHMTASTFHNKLKKEGTNYQDLLDQIRKELAEQYIGKDGMSMAEATYLLGFTDCSNFSRAFKRWVGMSPRDYRSSLDNS